MALIAVEAAEEREHLLANNSSQVRRRHNLIVLMMMLLVIASGAANSVARKVMTKPMGNYSLFVTLFSAAAYVGLYHSILFVKYCLGMVSKSSLRYPWEREKQLSPPKTKVEAMWNKIPPIKYFIIIGFMECNGNILQIVATQYLTGPMVSLLGQTTVFFSMSISWLMFRTKYSITQIFAVFVVVGGAMIPMIHDLLLTHSEGGMPAPFEYYIIMAVSSLPMAISFGIKEMIFKRQKGIEIFLVNGMSSLFQLLWWPVAIPITLVLKQTGGMPLGKYITSAFECFIGREPDDVFAFDCRPNPYPYLVYIAINLFFNIAILLLIKRASAVQSIIALIGVLPTSVLLFALHWPLIGKTPLSLFVIISMVTVVLGLVLHRYATIINEKKLGNKYTTLRKEPMVNQSDHDIVSNIEA